MKMARLTLAALLALGVGAAAAAPAGADPVTAATASYDFWFVCC